MRISAINNTNFNYGQVKFTANSLKKKSKKDDNIAKYTRKDMSDSFQKGILAGLAGTVLVTCGIVAVERNSNEKYLKKELDALQDEFYYGDLDKYQYNIFHCNDDMIPDILLYKPDSTYVYIDVVNRKIVPAKGIN